MNFGYFYDYGEFADEMPVNNSVGALCSLYHHMIVCTISYHVSLFFPWFPTDITRRGALHQSLRACDY